VSHRSCPPSAVAITLAALLAGCGGKPPAVAPAGPTAATAPAGCTEAALEHAAQQRLAEAVAEATRCTDLAPGDAAARDTLGELLLRARDLTAAERAFEAALGLRKDLALAYQGLAVVRFHRGDSTGGEAALRAGIAVTPAIDPTYARTRLTEDLATAHFMAGREREAVDALRASAEAQALDAPTREAVTRVGHARLLLQARRWSDVLAELRAARVPGAKPYVDSAVRSIEIRAWVGAGDLPRAAQALDVLGRELGAGHPRVLEPAFAVALAQGDLSLAASIVVRIAEGDPYAAEAAELELARALRKAGREREARERFDSVAQRYLRSVQSAYVRRAAAAEQAGPAERAGAAQPQ
jgi:tetratricopeptide (TPR) repeat protein